MYGNSFLYNYFQIRKWVKLPQITRRLDNRNSQDANIVRLSGSYATSRMGRAVVTTFAVIILGVDFGYDEGTGDKSGIDYFTTTLLYFLITELKFNKSEDHVIVR